MAKPVDLRSITPETAEAIADAIALANPTLDAAEIQAAFEAALAASEPIDVNIVGGSSVPFQTGEEAIAAPPTVTQLPAQSTPNGAILRADEDFYIYSTNSGSDGFLVYEGDDIRMTTISNLDQVYIQPAKNQAITLWWMTI